MANLQDAIVEELEVATNNIQSIESDPPIVEIAI
jgi:hypothetical protein